MRDPSVILAVTVCSARSACIHPQVMTSMESTRSVFPILRVSDAVTYFMSVNPYRVMSCHVMVKNLSDYRRRPSLVELVWSLCI